MPDNCKELFNTKPFTYYVYSSILQSIFEILNPVHCRESVNFSVSSVVYFETTLLTDNKFAIYST